MILNMLYQNYYIILNCNVLYSFALTYLTCFLCYQLFNVILATEIFLWNFDVVLSTRYKDTNYWCWLQCNPKQEAICFVIVRDPEKLSASMRLIFSLPLRKCCLSITPCEISHFVSYYILWSKYTIIQFHGFAT